MHRLFSHRAQVVIEYLILSTIVAVMVIMAMIQGPRNLLNPARQMANEYYETGAKAIVGGYYDDAGKFVRVNPDPIHGRWCDWGACIDGWKERECACPRPAFGGNYCPGGIAVSSDGCGGGGGPPCTPICGGRVCGLDPTGCGVPCGPMCPPPSVCTDGQCVCTPSCGTRNCGADPGGCPAGCGTCSATQTCTAGHCQCPAGMSPCGASCMNLQTDFYNCGSCGHKCPAGAACVGGSCDCPPGMTDVCDDTCVDFQSNNNHCGGCPGAVCSGGPTCLNGVCDCPPGQVFCAGVGCLTLGTNANCAFCGNVCTNGEQCIGNSCQCPPGQVPCPTGCTTLGTDANCAGCGNVCSGFETCNSGTCSCITQCAGKCSGADGCGGLCPNTCVGPQYVCGVGSVCECVPQCTGLCGGEPDGCGGECRCPDTCRNGIRDFLLGERGIDCGGPCVACSCPMQMPYLSGCNSWASFPPASAGQTVHKACPATCTGPGVDSTCQENGTWTALSGSCAATSCPTAIKGWGVCYVWIDVPLGTTMNFECPGEWCSPPPSAPGYAITATCNMNGTWSISGDCTEVACPPATLGAGDCQVNFPMTEMHGLPSQACPGGCHGGYMGTGIAWGYCQAGNWGWFSEPCLKNCPPGQLDCGGACVPLGTDAHCSSCAPCTAAYRCVSGSCELKPDSCAGLDIPTLCGNAALPSAANGGTSTVNCPTGCRGTLSRSCAGGAFGPLSGACTVKDCVDKVVNSTCGDVYLPGVPSGETSSVACPTGCFGTVYSVCTMGAFGTVNDNCEPVVPVKCPALVNQSVGIGSCAKNFSTGESDVGVIANVGCGGTCTGALSLRCAVGGSWVTEENSCVPLPICGNDIREGTELCDGNAGWCPPAGMIPCQKECNVTCNGFGPCLKTTDGSACP